MRFDGNISELGFEYHATSETATPEARVIRWVLSKKATEDQEKEIAKYENLKLVRDGARYRYDPHQVWDVVYQNLEPENETEEDEEIATEEVEEDISDEVWEDQEFGGSIYDRILPAMEVANNLKSQYQELAKLFPESSELFEDLANSCQSQLDQLATVLNTDTITKIGE